MKKTDIYIGLNDRETLEQKFDTKKYVSIMQSVCVSYGISFSFSLIEGGYINEAGEYTKENTLLLTLIDTDAPVIREIVNDLCVFFNQETIMVTISEVDVFFAKGDLIIDEL